MGEELNANSLCDRHVQDWASDCLLIVSCDETDDRYCSIEVTPKGLLVVI